jgi:hypothetical protein
VTGADQHRRVHGCSRAVSVPTVAGCPARGGGDGATGLDAPLATGIPFSLPRTLLSWGALGAISRILVALRMPRSQRWQCRYSRMRRS